jgi:hypothetical protein
MAVNLSAFTASDLTTYSQITVIWQIFLIGFYCRLGFSKMPLDNRNPIIAAENAVFRVMCGRHRLRFFYKKIYFTLAFFGA